MKLKLLTTLAAGAAVCCTLIPQQADAYYRGWRAGWGYGGVYRSYAAYRPYYAYAAYRPYYRYAAYRPYYAAYRPYYRPYYSYAAYRPYLAVGAAYASAVAYNSVAWSPYYAYAGYGYYPAAYATCGYGWAWRC